MQWFGWGVTVAAEIALVAVALRLFLSWPRAADDGDRGRDDHDPAVVRALPRRSACVGRVDRLLAHTVSLTGLTGVVVARVPRDRARARARRPKTTSGPSSCCRWSRPASPRSSTLPARARLTGVLEPARVRRAARPRRGAADVRQPAVARDPARRAAAPAGRVAAQDAWRCEPPRCGRDRAACSSGRSRCPSGARPTLTLTEAEQPVVARAGVSGPAWLRCLAAPTARRPGRTRCCGWRRSRTRASCSGSSWSSGPSDADAFSDDEESALAELARQVGLALHNVQLDSALQESLEEVQRQAEELRASRARVVAAADAERRRDRARPPRRRPAAPGRAGRDRAARPPDGRHATPSRPRRCSTSSAGRSRRRCRSCATSPTASTRRC